MEWNYAPECISVIILCIIWIYSRQGHSLPTLKNKMFQVCFLSTFLAMTTNIASTVLIMYYDRVPVWLNILVATIYFIATPLMGVVYFCYSLAILYENQPRFPRWLILFFVPSIIYVIMVVLNLLNHCLFYITKQDGYVQGPYIFSTYIVFYIYCMSCLIIVLVAGKQVEKSVKAILTAFPIIATVVIVVQQIFPYVMLSGTAATCALLIIYLNLQNKQIYNDYLLGIPNRQEFRKTLQLYQRRSRQESFTCIVFSLRNFKQVNDTYGPKQGDEFLKQISAYLNRLFQTNQLYRFSGDEFALLIGGDSDDVIDEKIDSFMERMEEPWSYGGYSAVIGAVAGIVKYPDLSDNAQGILNAIEYAVLWAKNGKEGKVCRCRQEMLDKAKRRIQIIGIIKDAVETEGFEVYYQPMWSVKDKKFTMCESLLRLPNTPLGPIYPDEFIPLAEETGLIIPLTYQILEWVCRFIRSLLEKGVSLESISVNFSAVQFVEPYLAEKVLDIISGNQIPFDKIKIELTESLLAESRESVEIFIEKMHQNGIQIEMDDFGTGYCNLASVMSLPVDIVKIDKSFLWSASKNVKSAAMMKTIVQLVHDFGMRVVSEGVEDDGQRAFVETCECEWIQGYYYAKPMPRDQAEKMLIYGVDRS